MENKGLEKIETIKIFCPYRKTECIGDIYNCVTEKGVCDNFPQEWGDVLMKAKQDSNKMDKKYLR